MAAAQAHQTGAKCSGQLHASVKLAPCRQEHTILNISAYSGAAEGAVEMDPTQRYIRYPFLLGKGACKRVYKAFDLEEGIEVAWNKAELCANDMDPEQQERLFAEIRVLKTLKHRNIITCYDWWHDATNQTINFITEYFTSGTLRQYRKKHLHHISDSAIKRWAFQILEGLLYLHAHTPPIIHRDLKCDNILVNGTSGRVKIADLGLASCQRGMSVVGTPEFMAPEMYDEGYDEKVDIYAFGMCMLELATLEYPYSECKSIPAIFMRVSKGIPPAALAKVSSDSLRQLITICIDHNPQQRPGALQLLKHPFFAELTERPSGSPTCGGVGSSSRHSTTFSPPFGSCGNLMALSHGSIGQQAASMHTRELLGAQGAASGDISSKSMPQSPTEADTQSKAPSAVTLEDETRAADAAAAAVATTADDPAVSAAVAAGLRPVKARKSARFHPRFNDDVDAASLQETATTGVDRVGGNASRTVDAMAAVAGGARGTTVCVAKIGRSRTVPEDEDSDEEVLVPLEDVLVPHPEDFLAAQTLGLTTQLTHAASGCMIVSGPGYQMGEGLAGLLEHVASLDSDGTGMGLLSRLTSTVAALQQQQQFQLDTLQDMSEQALEQQFAHTADPLQQPQVEPPALGDSTPATRKCSRPCSRLGSVSGAPWPAMQGAATQLMDRQPSGASANLDTGISEESPTEGFSCSDTPSRRPLSASLTSATSAVGSSAAVQLLHNMSSMSSRHPFSSGQAAGALAAAGLLQVSPGCFTPTPLLLEKLLSKASAPRGQAALPGSLCRQSSTAQVLKSVPAGPPLSSNCTLMPLLPKAHAAEPQSYRQQQKLGEFRSDFVGAVSGKAHHHRSSSQGSDSILGGVMQWPHTKAHDRGDIRAGINHAAGQTRELPAAGSGGSTSGQPRSSIPSAQMCLRHIRVKDCKVSGGREILRGCTTLDSLEQQAAGSIEAAGGEADGGAVDPLQLSAAGWGETSTSAAAGVEVGLPGTAGAAQNATSLNQNATCVSKSRGHRATADAVPAANVELLGQQAGLGAMSAQAAASGTNSCLVPVLDCAVTAAPGAAPTAGGAGGFGLILVRRRFVRGLPQVNQHVKRYV